MELSLSLYFLDNSTIFNKKNHKIAKRINTNTDCGNISDNKIRN